jgi:hypothetical protein
VIMTVMMSLVILSVVTPVVLYVVIRVSTEFIYLTLTKTCYQGTNVTVPFRLCSYWFDRHYLPIVLLFRANTRKCKNLIAIP